MLHYQLSQSETLADLSASTKSGNNLYFTLNPQLPPSSQSETSEVFDVHLYSHSFSCTKTWHFEN